MQRVLGASLVELPATPPRELGGFAVTTANGTLIEGDLWFRTQSTLATWDCPG